MLSSVLWWLAVSTFMATTCLLQFFLHTILTLCDLDLDVISRTWQCQAVQTEVWTSRPFCIWSSSNSKWLWITWMIANHMNDCQTHERLSNTWTVSWFYLLLPIVFFLFSFFLLLTFSFTVYIASVCNDQVFFVSGLEVLVYLQSRIKTIMTECGRMGRERSASCGIVTDEGLMGSRAVTPCSQQPIAERHKHSW